jgi:uncharacterized protein (TIGR00255 family)
MIQSMTGFGSAQTELPTGIQLCCDVKTLNHKYLDVSTSINKALKPFEPHIIKQLKAGFQRGRIEVSLYFEAHESGELPLEINQEKARAYVDQLEALKKELSLSGEVDISLVASLRDVFEKGDLSNIPAETLLLSIQKVLQEAIKKALEMRISEGKAIFDDFSGRITHLKDDLAYIQNKAEENVTLWRERLRTRVEELSHTMPIDESRMEQEILFHALRSDITEECVRLQNHIAQFEKFLSEEGTFGKKLGFLIHEMTREVNTIGAKAMSKGISEKAISLRDEIEHLREQIYNIE